MSGLKPEDLCPAYAPLLGAFGLAFSIVFTCAGAAYGTARAGTGALQVGVMRPDLVLKSTIPVAMAGVVGIYGLITDVAILLSMKGTDYSLFAGAMHLSAGMSTGFSGLAAGIAIGVVGDVGVRGVAQQPRLFVGMMLILIFAEVLGLYGMILAIFFTSKGGAVSCK